MNTNHDYKTGFIYDLPVSGIRVVSGYCATCRHVHNVLEENGAPLNMRALPVEDRVVILHAQLRVLPN